MTNSTYQDDFKYLFDDLEDDKATIRDQELFLARLWNEFPTVENPSYGVFAFRHRKTKQFMEKSMKITGLVKSNGLLAQFNRWDWDQYFGVVLFSKSKRQKGFARDTRYALCDVDGAAPFAFDPHPSVVWETSPGRSQALWMWDKKLTPLEAETHSRALTYRHGGDKNGWPINKLLRLPGSINHKEEYDEPFVRLLHYDEKPITTRPKPFNIKGRSYSAEPLILDFDHKAHKRLDVLKKYRSDLDPKARVLIRHKKAYEKDRSDQIFHMVVGLHEVGATIDEIASVIWDSPYFQSKYPDNLGALDAELSRIMSKIGGAL
jgi:hypothetical protein